MAPGIKKQPTLKLLMVQLKNIQTSLDDILRFVQNYEPTCTASAVNVRLHSAENLWEKYGTVLNDIQAHDDFEDEEGTFDQARLIYSDRYYDCVSFLMDKAKELQGPDDAIDISMRGNETLSAGHGMMDHVRLPQIKLQSFNGNIDEWISFRDLYTSLIHRKVDLPEVEKFHYLKGCLQGEPKGLIDPLKITRNNYQVAWEMLLKRYDNSKQLKKRQVQALFSLPTLSKESVTDLHTLMDGFERIVQNLDQVIKPEEYKDLLLVNLLTSRLDPVTRRGWEEQSSTKDQDTLADLTDFMHRRICILESLPSKASDVKGSQQVQQPSRYKSSAVKASCGSVQSSGGRCVVCKENHPLYMCSSFQRLSVRERDGVLRSNALCRNCFKSNHQARECPSKYFCRGCKGRHHTMVCFKAEKSETAKVAAVTSTPTESVETSGSTSQVINMLATESSVSGSAQQFSSQVLLATAVVIVEDDEGSQFPARALLDSGSESNFITERLSQRIRTQREKVDISVLGIGQAAMKVKYRIQALVCSRVSEFSRNVSFLVLPKVTADLPTAKVNVEGWSIPNGISLADPAFFNPGAVDMVLGIEFFFDFFESGRRISIGKQLPTLNESVFGWVVCGGLMKSTEGLRVNCSTASTAALEELVTRFWISEEVGGTKILSSEEKRCEELFQRTFRRDPDGRYFVSLPKDEDAISRMGESRDIAFRRFQGTERRLAKDASLKEQYHKFMAEYVQLGHMTKVDNMEESEKRCYLPHHPVIKETSTTTKLRVVFDASCKTSSGISLNDSLLVGPIVQQDLRSIMLRSRMKQIMLVADVEKMFRQIFIVPEDRHLQCILWRFDAADPVDVYELNTVTYGTKSAPFLATRTLNQLAMDEEHQYPLAARAATEDTYMDDVITGTDTIQAACELRVQLEEMTMKGRFRLRKWASNNPTVLEGISEDNLAIRLSEGIDLDPDSTVKTLGLTWLPNTDQLRFKFDIPLRSFSQQLSKRQVLSVIATLFDPLGLLGAVITTAKTIMQLLWKFRNERDQALDWDQPLPSTVGEIWRAYYDQLPLLNDVRIDRCVTIPEAIKIEIHCFSDASTKAYGGCVYVRSQDGQGGLKVRLLSSKSKIAPLKTQTIPRLELCGALLTAQLYEKIRDSIRTDAQAFFWVDSTCVLRWIQASPNVWNTFVANRVAKIQAITEPSQWFHVSGKENPADLISRGIAPGDIVKNTFWWEGPEWLKSTREYWPLSPLESFPDEESQERPRTMVSCAITLDAEFNEWYLGRFSSYSDLIRKTAYWLRLMRLLRKDMRDRVVANSRLSNEELNEAELTMVRRVQREAFADEWNALTKSGTVPRRSPLRWFHPHIAEDNVIRVGGRLEHSAEAYDVKHPIVLPARHAFTRLILNHYHLKLLHAGPQLLLGAVRLRFWPLGGRNLARHVVHQCIKCFRSKPSAIQQFMGDLPSPRVSPSRPFSQTGVDYFGPMYIRPAPRKPAIKVYVAIFVCLCTKAVHLELVMDLTTDRFLLALRRFVARRGKCQDIYSDNGTNFVGARNRMKDFLQLLKSPNHREKVSKECNEDGIRWHFSPPSSPHFGGLWEAAVRSAKNHLLKVMGESCPSAEELNTL